MAESIKNPVPIVSTGLESSAEVRTLVSLNAAHDYFASAARRRFSALPFMRMFRNSTKMEKAMAKYT